MQLGGHSWTQLKRFLREGGLCHLWAEVAGLGSRCNVRAQIRQGLGKTPRSALMNVPIPTEGQWGGSVNRRVENRNWTWRCPGPVPPFRPFPAFTEPASGSSSQSNTLSFTCEHLHWNAAVGGGCLQKTGSLGVDSLLRSRGVCTYMYLFKRPLPVDCKRVWAIVRLTTDRGQQVPYDARATCGKSDLSLGIWLHWMLGVQGGATVSSFTAAARGIRPRTLGGCGLTCPWGWGTPSNACKLSERTALKKIRCMQILWLMCRHLKVLQNLLTLLIGF